ncbi:hypothetical protein C8R42DRAFT_42423 [Lentinula raphanica]|nr:hypothetical protein C8R42DRAFT_42423 [Lentinula raphanica]
MKSSHLSKKLNFDEETAVSFKGLLSGSDDLKLNLRIHGDLAFIYDPIFLEDTTIPATYLFDWGRPDDNETILSYIQAKSSQNDSVFHTFVYILRTKRWYYVGAQKWTQTSLRWDVWESFDDIRSRLIQRLHDHCGTILERETIAEMLENGDLQQICIHISGDGHIDTSRTMCKTLGYDSPSE